MSAADRATHERDKPIGRSWTPSTRPPGQCRIAAISAATVLAVVGVAACGGGSGDSDAATADAAAETRSADAGGAADADGDTEGRESAEPGADTPQPAEGNARGPDPERRGRRVEPARCPYGAADCRTATGRIVFVEAVDPDGDGDAHFVLLGSDSITAPGISVIDVAVDLRPEPLPEVGDTISASGPVFPGSYGQRQIQAVELNVAGRS